MTLADLVAALARHDVTPTSLRRPKPRDRHQPPKPPHPGRRVTGSGRCHAPRADS